MPPIRCAIAALVATIFAGACMAQKAVTFNQKTAPGGVRPSNIFSVDLNGDGLPDIVQDHATVSSWSAILSTGPGTFGSPIPAPPGMEVQSALMLTIGDFNGDGIPDIAAPVYGSNVLELRFGQGNGTFSDNTFAAFYSNGQFWDFPGYRVVATADLNEDGNPDVIGIMDGGSGPMIYVMPGNGAGGFGNPVSTGASGVNVTNIVVGDFNRDGHADVAFVYPTVCGAEICSSTLHVMYGDGKLGFRDSTPYTANGPLNVAAGDLNSDGITDLFGVDTAAGQLAVFYGQADGTLTSYFTSAPSGTFGATSGGTSPQLAMADFNGDSKMDLVGFEHNQAAVTDSLVFFLSTGSPGAFTTQIVPLPSHLYTTNPVVADFNRDGKPDVLVSQSDGGNATLRLFLNSTGAGIWSNCLYPGKGINVCSPNQSAVSPVAFNASATSFGDLRKMELWIDGKKIGEQHHTWGTEAWFNSSASLANGTHSITFFSGGIDGTLQRINYSLNVGPSTCPAPSSPGVAVCTPTAGATVGSSIAVQASAMVDGTFARMEIWVDGVKEFTQFTTPYLNATVPAGAGTHQIVVYAANTLGVTWRSAVSVTVQ